MMEPTKEQINAGQAVYTKRNLALYDLLVLRISNRYIWQCPSARIEEHYNQNLSNNHLDVGVGTGYFLDGCRFPSASPRIALIDLNHNTLEYVSKRISRYEPETYKQNILEPISEDIQQFDSVSINYLLHCLPGSLLDKALVFDNLKPLMNPGAVIFGSTILNSGITGNWAAKQLMNFYNKKEIFSNATDNLEDLRLVLERRLNNLSIETIGCAALFSGNF